MTAIAEVLVLSTEYLSARGSPTARLDSELLLADALGLSRIELYTQHDRVLTAAELDRCRELVRRRGAREPVAYILGRWGFRRLDLAVDGRVLVPRPETELAVDHCLALLAGRDRPAVLDLGTGSGAIALSIAAECPEARVTAGDLSQDALDVAAINAERNGLEVELVRTDLFAALDGRTFDLIVANPPYVAAGEIDSLEPEVAVWEPRGATVAGPDGLEVYRRLLPAAGDHLLRGGALVLECGMGQAGWLREQLGSLGYGALFTDRDLGGIERVVGGTWS
ncbi:MAG: peptide chain release factor N(5)-glutamine methyltransferase [Gaiellales bacterium]